ncbi:MAG TPA: enoyl-CoA hydratase/isomerase family protein [Gemmatimonadales bacterium]|nr:enoyl-CoA hydratase/isomerase family protein [Gemmatimonadales bacterium]
MSAAARVACAIEGGVARLTLNNPPLNILTRLVLGELRVAVRALGSDATLRVAVLSGEGKHFSAGADVAEHLPPAWEAMIPEFLETVAALRAFPLPLVAAVRGRCLGGAFEIVQAADLVVAGESAVFGQPEIVLGVIPPAACALLPDLAGPARAAEIVFTGDPMTAAEARTAGLVVRVVPDERVDEEALALAARIARHSAAALRVAKRALRSPARERMEAEALAAAGRRYAEELMRTADATEGLTAFLEKRSPAWTHR